MKKIYIELVSILSIVVYLLTGCSMNKDYSEQKLFFDTVITINIYDAEDKAVMEDCLILCEKYEKMFSKTIEGSDVWKLNHAQGEWVEVSKDTIEVLGEATQYSKLTAGMFDITIAPLTELWHVKDNDGELPSQEKIEKEKSHIDYQLIQIKGNKVRLKDKKAQIDLGGIAKGFIADKLGELITSRGVTSAMINLGGNIKVIGSKKDGSAWNIGIQKPFGDRNEVLGSVKVRDKTVVSSGIYERYFEYEGKIYHHIIDKTTGAPSESDLEGVTIIGDSSTMADALSTACVLLGSEKGMELIENIDGVEAVFVKRDGSVIESGGVQLKNEMKKQNKKVLE